MKRLTATFARSLVIFAIAQSAGCDEPTDVDFDDLEFRTAGAAAVLPIAEIPFLGPIETSFTIPLQPAAKLKPKDGFDVHPPTDFAYLWTPDPTGDNALMVDINGVSPYSANLDPVDKTVCDPFLAQYPYEVPVLQSEEACSEVEQGCCDYVCYLWGAQAIKDQGENIIEPVTNDTFDTEMVEGTYIATGRISWDKAEDNGGHNPRLTPCACQCWGDPDAA